MGPAGILAEASSGEAPTQVTAFPEARLLLGAILAAVTEGSREAVLAATLAVVTAAFPVLHTEAASQGAALLAVATRVEADMVVGGIKRRTE